MENKTIEEIKSVITEEEVVNIINDLVKIPSHPGIKNQETEVARYIHNLFLKEGIQSEVIPVVDGRCNVLAKIKGKGNGKSLLLTGHTDTVPPYDMADPYNIKIENGKMFGRGVVDMKGPLACMIASMIGIKRANIELEGDLIFAGVIDEEHKSEGTIALLESNLKADAAIVGEPSNLDICLAHRGLEWLEFTFEGKAVHGGKQEEGINAILKASDFIQAMEENMIPKVKKSSHPLIGTGSLNYGTIKGGTQPSTVAGECSLTIDRRWLPGESYEDILNDFNMLIDQLHKNDEEFNCNLKVMDISVMKDGYVHEAMEIDPEHPIIDIVINASEKITGTAPKKTYFPAWSDGGLLSSYGKIPTIIFAPGDLESAHSANEFLELSQVFPATLVYALIAINFCK